MQEKQEANAIRSQDKKIQLPNGFKVLVCRSVAQTLPFVLVQRVIENVKDQSIKLEIILLFISIMPQYGGVSYPMNITKFDFL